MKERTNYLSIPIVEQQQQFVMPLHESASESTVAVDRYIRQILVGSPLESDNKYIEKGKGFLEQPFLQNILESIVSEEQLGMRWQVLGKRIIDFLKQHKTKTKIEYRAQERKFTVDSINHSEYIAAVRNQDVPFIQTIVDAIYADLNNLDVPEDIKPLAKVLVNKLHLFL